MNKHRWLIVAGLLSIAACRATEPVVCADAVPSGGAHHNADEVGLVECATVLPALPGSEAR